MDDGTRLYELFMVLFRSEAELRRSLALDGRLSSAMLPSGKGSLSEAAFAAARALQEDGLIDDALFTALERRSPERSKDIEEVARFYGVRSAPARTSWIPGRALWRAVRAGLQNVRNWVVARGRGQLLTGLVSGPEREVPQEVTEFAEQLRAELEALEIPDDSARALDPDHWPWTAAAAVLGSFQPTALRPVAGSSPGIPALVALADFVFTSFNGRWVLRQEFRIPCLERLHSEGGFTPALEANEDLHDLHSSMIGRLLDDWSISLADSDPAELEALGTVVGWLEPVLGKDLPVSRAAVNAVTERRLLLEPLRTLVGKYFRGRTEELSMIGRHIAGTSAEQVLLIEGPGGIGKSSLMGKVLLNLESQAPFRDPVPFAYIDFDRARHDPNDPIGLLEQVARQLRLLYATAGEAAAEFAAVESYAAGTDLERAAEILQIGRARSLGSMVEILAERLREVGAQVTQESVLLVLVLDTFEEVQVKGPGAVNSVLNLLERLQEALPSMRVIVSGRSVTREFETIGPMRLVALADLDLETADAVLAERGVRNPQLRQQITGQFGSNPLTLRLAAEALKNADIADDSFVAVVTEADALALVSAELVQGILYGRILGHIADPDVLKVAYPGLAVRYVTVEVLRQVLAEPCGFEPGHAEDIFERLQDEVAMFDLEDPDTLRHRQDLRRLMLRTMRDEPRQAMVVADIHRRATAYYQAKTGDQARAEEIYHRLMAGEEPRGLNRLWTPRLAPTLASAMEDPLPPRAASWLGRRLGLVSTDERTELEQEDWEGDAAGRASSWLAADRPADSLAVLSERPERVAGSRLYALEVAAHMAMGNLEQATVALDRGLHSALDCGDHAAQLELLEQAITLRARRSDPAGVIEAARSAAALTDLTGERVRGLWALTDAALYLPERDRDRRTNELNAEISRRFSQFSRSEMRDQPELVRRVLRTAGRTDSTVLVDAALEVGDERQDDGAVFIEDSFALGRLLEQTTSDARPALAELASEVGLPEADWSIEELASRAVRFGRTGKAIVLSLDYARDDRAARRLVVNELVRPSP